MCARRRGRAWLRQGRQNGSLTNLMVFYARRMRDLTNHANLLIPSLKLRSRLKLIESTADLI